jgi:hypothetical protein
MNKQIMAKANFIVELMVKNPFREGVVILRENLAYSTNVRI